ncbi:MAG: 4-hydroxybenzoate 3-monooxygenase [Acidothermales bacterium]|nr:4-hydroxybenzoate 3-monooxygenase [Acidothermales bacterium]
MRTQVAIVGAGPAGLVLSHLLDRLGIECVVLEARDREYVQGRVRAGVLEQGTVDVLRHLGLADRLERDGIPHHGLELRFDGVGHRIPLTDLTGRSIWIYGQQQVVEDLVAARLETGGPLLFDVSDVRVHDVDTGAPRVEFRDADGEPRVLYADLVAGCDGFHGVCRESIPDGVLRTYLRDYPFGWLGILAEVPPSTEELIYCRHRRGFALHSLRSPALSRLYLQVDPDEDIGDWPDERIWGELHARFATEGWSLAEGPIVDKGVTPMRSFVTEPMRYGRLFLAGDAAHIVPPTGAKGLNLAVADVVVLADALAAWYRDGNAGKLDAYSELCLRRVWRVQQFSWWMTSMLHVMPDHDEFGERVQRAELAYVAGSLAASTVLAENYVGLPLPVEPP